MKKAPFEALPVVLLEPWHGEALLAGQAFSITSLSYPDFNAFTGLISAALTGPTYACCNRNLRLLIFKTHCALLAALVVGKPGQFSPEMTCYVRSFSQALYEECKPFGVHVLFFHQALSDTTLSVSELAFLPGFEHSQSFSRLLKLITNFTPSEYRGTLNWSNSYKAKNGSSPRHCRSH